MANLVVAWISELRPIPPSFDDILGSVPPLPISSEYHTPTAEPQTPLPLSRDFIDGQTPVLSPPSDVPSDFTTDEFNRVSIPKPDITLGLSHASFSQLQGKILWDLQDSKRVLSEPHQSAIGLHFPFLVVEAKGLATGSNMVAAQNQAAVDGACALNILHELKLAVETDRRPASTDQPVSQQILFSIVTEGPIHELWVHYRLDDAYHMTALRVWRTTTAKDAREFVQALSKILEWGVSKFRSAILIELAAIEAVLRQRRIE